MKLRREVEEEKEEKRRDTTKEKSAHKKVDVYFMTKG